jgi:hypothetical protein
MYMDSWQQAYRHSILTSFLNICSYLALPLTFLLNNTLKLIPLIKIFQQRPQKNSKQHLAAICTPNSTGENLTLHQPEESVCTFTGALNELSPILDGNGRRKPSKRKINLNKDDLTESPYLQSLKQ